MFGKGKNTMLDLTSAIDQLIVEAEIAALPTWDGAPLHYTSAYHTPDELAAALERWRAEQTPGTWRRCHLWRPAPAAGALDLEHHNLTTWITDLRCDHHGAEYHACSCVGELLYKSVCSVCSWQAITDDENTAVEAWHDHAMPGWRDLPTLPSKLRGHMGTRKMTPALEAWFDANYPENFRVPGAPILTDRGGSGMRHVPDYSPYGGFDLSDHN